MSVSTLSIAMPGQHLGPASKYRAGPGTHIHESSLFASVLGVVQVRTPAKAPGPTKRANKLIGPWASTSDDQLPTISVARVVDDGTTTITTKALALDRDQPRAVLPEVGNIVLCRVMRLVARQAVVAILVCGNSVLATEWQGVIRAQDVRAMEKDRVRIVESFRPGDIVRAEVISLGDQANYYLSTARNELGVIMATSEAGNAMHPASWKEYVDPETGMREPRKAAKPF